MKQRKQPQPESRMLREIEEQPQVLERILQREGPRMERFARFLHGRSIRTVILVARGTSDNAALFARYLIEITTAYPVSLAAPSIHTLYKSRLNLADTLTVGISQSGESTDINVALRSCRRQGSLVVAITNDGNSEMAGIADQVFLIHAGQERSVAATKTYTGQLMLSYLLAGALADRKFDLAPIPDYAAQALRLKEEVRAKVERYRYMQQCVVIGRGLLYADAFEVALKLMETCYVVAKGYSAADFFHGPIAVIEQDFPVILLVPTGRTLGHMKRMLRRLGSLGAETVVVSNDPTALAAATTPLALPAAIDELHAAIPFIIPGQMFAAFLAESRGLSPDRPRGLKKITRTL